MVIAKKITKLIGWFYFPPIAKIVPFQTFLYAACGGCNMVFNWVLFFVIYNFVVAKESVDIGSISISAHSLTFWIVFPIVLYTGFWLNKYIVFTNSISRTGVQLVRYVISVAGSVLLSDLGLRLFVDVLGVYPTPSYIVVSCLSVAYSYVMQKYFTFKRVG